MSANFFPMSRPPLDSTPFGTDTTNEKISHLESTPVGEKIPDPKPLKRPTESSKRNEKSRKSMYRRTRSQAHHCQNHHRANMISPMTTNTENLEARANLIWLMTANTSNLNQKDAIKRKASEVHEKEYSDSSSSDSDSSGESDYKSKRRNKKKISSEKGPYQIMVEINGKVADNSI